LTQKLFSNNPDIQKNAYLNWRTCKRAPAHNLFVLASNYADGAFIMIDAIITDNKDKKADGLIMPILYSIDQSIELFIKAIIRLLEEQHGGTVSNYAHHNIEELKNQMVAKIRKIASKTVGLEKHLKPVTDFINELYTKIKVKNSKGQDVVNIDFARYPFDNDGNPHFYVDAPNNVVIDVENLRKIFTDIRVSLESLYFMYESINP